MTKPEEVIVDDARTPIGKFDGSLKHIALVEVNEAFAAQVMVLPELDIPPSKINFYGGAISLGNPTGNSVARCPIPSYGGSA